MEDYREEINLDGLYDSSEINLNCLSDSSSESSDSDTAIKEIKAERCEEAEEVVKRIKQRLLVNFHFKFKQCDEGNLMSTSLSCCCNTKEPLKLYYRFIIENRMLLFKSGNYEKKDDAVDDLFLFLSLHRSYEMNCYIKLKDFYLLTSHPNGECERTYFTQLYLDTIRHGLGHIPKIPNYKMEKLREEELEREIKKDLERVKEKLRKEALDKEEETKAKYRAEIMALCDPPVEIKKLINHCIGKFDNPYIIPELKCRGDAKTEKHFLVLNGSTNSNPSIYSYQLYCNCSHTPDNMYIQSLKEKYQFIIEANITELNGFEIYNHKFAESCFYADKEECEEDFFLFLRTYKNYIGLCCRYKKLDINFKNCSILTHAPVGIIYSKTTIPDAETWG